jgi:hypothetical protein
VAARKPQDKSSSQNFLGLREGVFCKAERGDWRQRSGVVSSRLTLRHDHNRRETRMRNSDEPVAWVVYQIILDKKPEAMNVVC